MKRPFSNFAFEMQKLAIGLNVNDLTISIRIAGLGKRLTPQYIGQLRLGTKRPSRENVDMIAQVLHLDGDQRRQLHVAAARDAGFDV